MTPFWDFSVALYAQPGIPELLVEMQDEHGADVNLVLAILWRGSLGQSLDTQALRTMDELIRPWREQVIQPLREVRRAMKPLATDAETRALRERVEACELESERLQQGFLQAMPPGQPGADPARAGLAAYAAMLRPPIPAAVIETLLIRAAIA